METFLTLSSTDPDHFQELMRPVAGSISVLPGKSSRFNADIKMARCEKIATFTINATSFRVLVEPPHQFYGLTIPLGVPFHIREGSQSLSFTNNTAHLLHHDKRFDFFSPSDCRVLCSNISADDLSAHSSRLNRHDSEPGSCFGQSISFLSPEGGELLRSVARFWAELRHQDTGFKTDIAIRELEDEVITNLVLAAQDVPPSSEPANPKVVASVEEFLMANLTQAVSRSELADIAGVSIRSLSRGFVKRHGMGPMQFLKTKRLDAAFRTLLAAEPDETTVTNVASNYGFNHFGKFAIEYKQVFGESPSETLRH